MSHLLTSLKHFAGMTMLLASVTSVALAGTIRERAVAAVAVARAALEIADERPVLSDSQSRSVLRSDNQTTWDTRNRKDPVAVSSNSAVIEFHRSALLSDSLPAQLVIEHWERGCAAGDRLARDIRRQLVPLGWTIGVSSSDQIQFVHIPQTETCPRAKLMQNGKTVKTWQGYQDPAMLSQELRRAWDEAPTPTVAAAAGPAGAIHARPQIQRFLAQWQDRIGERQPVSFCWDRSGAASFNLRSQTPFKAKELFGDSGRFSFSAPGVVNLPADKLALAYRLDGIDVIIDADPVKFPGIVTQLERSIPTAASSDLQPAGSLSGMLTVYYLFCMGRDIYQLLTPSCDLLLGGTVNGSAILDNGSLTIDFRDGPTIRIAFLFTFPLKIERITINEMLVQVEFSGSRFVRSRTLEVK